MAAECIKCTFGGVSVGRMSLLWNISLQWAKCAVESSDFKPEKVLFQVTTHPRLQVQGTVVSFDCMHVSRMYQTFFSIANSDGIVCIHNFCYYAMIETNISKLLN